MKINNVTHILIIFGFFSCYVGEELPPDQEVWEYAYPTKVGLDDRSLYELDSLVKEGLYSQINGIIIIKDDQLVFENYYNLSGRNEVRPVGRVTFSILTLALDLFIADGYINLDERIQTYLPEYEEIFKDDSLKKLVTVRHLIEFKSGLAWNESLGIDNDLFNMKSQPDWVGYVLSKPMEAPPGLRTVINSGGGMILAKILQNQLENRSLLNYMHENLFSPIGINDVHWEESPNGTLNCSNGLFLKNIELTRIGYLMLNEGRWTNKRRVISRDWVLEITTEKSEVSNNYSFGYSWWLFSDPFNNNWIRLQENTTYFAAGESGQSLYVLPDKNMVICITAENQSVNFFNNSLGLFIKSLESLQPALTN